MEGYFQIARDEYTCVPVPGYEKDPAVTRAIREFDPGAVPMWRIQMWRFPGSTRPVRVVNHVIGRYLPVQRYLKRPFSVAVPADWRGPVPNMLDHVLEDDSIEQYKRGGPGGYVPWDWSLYRWCRWMYDRITVDFWLKASERHRARVERERAAAMAELEYRKKQIEPYLMRKAGEISDYTAKQYLRIQREREEAIRAGRTPPRLRDPKPFVVVRSPRHDDRSRRVAPASVMGEA
jgi:hypothetical protein